MEMLFCIWVYIHKSVLSIGCFLLLPGMPKVLSNNGLKAYKTELKDEFDFLVSR